MKVKLHIQKNNFECKKEFSAIESVSFIAKLATLVELTTNYDLDVLIISLIISNRQSDQTLLKKFKSNFKRMSLDVDNNPSYVKINVSLLDECDSLEYNDSDIENLIKFLLSESWIQTK